MNRCKNNFCLLAFLMLHCHATTVFAERGDRDKPMLMEANRVTVDDPRQTSTFEDQVKMQQGTLLIEADKMIVLQASSNYSKINASGSPAHFRQKRDGVNEFADGYGDRIEYDSQSEIANIYGNARIKREGDDVRGEHIIYNTKTGIFQVFGATEKNPEQPNQGRVTIVIQPKDKTANTQAASAPSTTHTQTAP